ncbi:4-coumarate--CoA ligase 1-like [Limulus polyphemus]|uniref:4-coumarate--CoA ligase 1-like n=1 Tax=Limulus polyphemus TaxID=6850 RepID=A0ABM1T2J6_LIMPO|nr:4-coumarate--CoA ligase 1-like [Limulus polyphemus]
MGECFCVYIPNSIDYVVAFLGIVSAGGIVTTANPSYTAEELQHQLNDSSAVYLLAAESNIQKAMKVKQSVLSLKEIFVLGNDEECCSRFSDLLEDDGSFFHKPVSVQPREMPLVLPYSSGTTGLPKGVILTHHNIISIIHQMTHPDIFPLTTEDVVLGVLPFFHCFGLVLVSLCSVIRGCPVVVMSRFKPELFLTAIQQYKVTVILLAPPIAHFLVESPLVDKYDLSSVTTILSGAAALHPQVAVKLQTKFPSARIGQGYGMTEVSPVACVPLVGQTLYESVGVPVPATRMKIVSISGGATLGPGEKGEILISGPQVMKGYLNNPEATSLTIDEDGWLHTGDVGFYTEDKNFYLVDRIKELIKYKGHQVAPAELELLLMKHPSICDAAVVGVPDPRVGDLARAFVVIKPSHDDITPQCVQEFIAEHVASYKHLHGGIEFVDHIPRNASGKILRRKLRAKIFPK